jgi:hypothetical protein
MKADRHEMRLRKTIAEHAWEGDLDAVQEFVEITLAFREAREVIESKWEFRNPFQIVEGEA